MNVFETHYRKRRKTILEDWWWVIATVAFIVLVIFLHIHAKKMEAENIAGCQTPKLIATFAQGKRGEYIRYVYECEGGYTIDTSQRLY